MKTVVLRISAVHLMKSILNVLAIRGTLLLFTSDLFECKFIVFSSFVYVAWGNVCVGTIRVVYAVFFFLSIIRTLTAAVLGQDNVLTYHSSKQCHQHDVNHDLDHCPLTNEKHLVLEPHITLSKLNVVT